ncbi:hypothetical protein GGI10_005054 [Coemansia sp. RSA 2530]|nr:hypothetical protein GGI10_005054 [Coemansia sp. RSA 2530]
MPPRRNPAPRAVEPDEVEVFKSGDEELAEDNNSSDDNEEDTEQETQDNAPPMCLDVLARTVPEFDSSYPLITTKWISLVKDTAPPSLGRIDQCVALARMCLTGEAKSRMSRYLDPKWSGFCERLLYLYSPDNAYHELTTEITSKKRYTGLPSIQVAITMAEDDHTAVLDYKRAKRTDLAGLILAALTILFPPEVLTSSGFDTYRKFSDQIKLLRKALATARTCDDRGANWAHAATATQVFAVVTNCARTRGRG